jgi:hypothetical protein
VIDPWPLDNIWLGTSTEDQARADERIPALLATPAAVRFLSCEPLLGPIDLRALRLSVEEIGGPECVDPNGTDWLFNAFSGEHYFLERGYSYGGDGPVYDAIDWVICGGESGPKSRPMHPDWARSLRDQCAAAGVTFFFKQWGAWAPDDLPVPKLPDPALAVKRGRISIYPDGTWRGRGFFPEASRNLAHMHQAGKQAAGRLLDGREHNDFPKPNPKGGDECLI